MNPGLGLGSLMNQELPEANTTAEWKTTENNRRAKYYSLTRFGKKALQRETQQWDRLSSALGRLNEAPILIDETPALNAIEVRSRARRLMRQYGKLGLVIVDYLQLMQSTQQGENRATELSEISRAMKSLAKELQVPVVALSQLNRSLEQRPDKRPVMSDLRESGILEQDADMIFFIYRDEVYN